MGLFITLCVCVLARARKIKTLKPSYFVSGVLGTFVGFPRNKRVIDGYARCLLCWADLSIAGRGLSSLWDHWKGVEHTRLEQKYRIMTHKPLRDKSCRPVSAEDRRIRRARLTEPPVFLESALKLTVEERIAIKEAEAEEGARPHLQDESVNYLWLSNFVSSFLTVTSFDGVLRSLDAWRDCMANELHFECRTLTYTRCQVESNFAVTLNGTCDLGNLLVMWLLSVHCYAFRVSVLCLIKFSLVYQVV